MDGFLELLGKIPASFWGVLIGSGFSLVGVIIANIYNIRRQREQFAEDRKLRIEDTASSLRKEIYLDVAEAIHAGIASIIRIADIRKSFDEAVHEYIKKSPALSKIFIIANERILKAVAEFMNEFNATQLKLAIERIQLEATQRELDSLDQQISILEEKRDGLLLEMKQYDTAKSGGMGHFDRISERFDETMDHIDQLWSDKIGKQRKLYVSQMDLLEYAIKTSQTLMKLSLPSITAVRAEMDIVIDEAVFTRILHESLEKQSAEAAKFITVLRELIASLDADEDESPAN